MQLTSLSSNKLETLPDELPVDYAYRVGQSYLAHHRPVKSKGQFFTPPSIARFMAKLLPSQNGVIRVLDPGAGAGILSCALCEVLDVDIELDVYEVDEQLAYCLEDCLSYARDWMRSKKHSLNYTIVRKDFVLSHPDIHNSSKKKGFDVVICNPPYLKLPKADTRAQIAKEIIHGQPNIYALFLAISTSLLRVGGHSVFITPRSFASGQYFSRFRQYFFSQMRPRAVHLFESRRHVFDKVLQESIIMLAERSTQDRDVSLSSSIDLTLRYTSQRTKAISEIVDKDNILHIPLSERDDSVSRVIRTWNGNLHKYGMEISTGPVVPFRATNLLATTGNVPSTHVPLMWMQNITPMQCEWPNQHHKQYIVREGAEKLLIRNQNYVLLRRFSAKEERRRLTAAPYLSNIDTPSIGLENHLNYIYRPNGYLTSYETRGLALLLNSEFMDRYFRIFSGNTQVSATELRKLPLPPLEKIVELGQLSGEVEINNFMNELIENYA